MPDEGTERHPAVPCQSPHTPSVRVGSSALPDSDNHGHLPLQSTNWRRSHLSSGEENVLYCKSCCVGETISTVHLGGGPTAEKPTQARCATTTKILSIRLWLAGRGGPVLKRRVVRNRQETNQGKNSAVDHRFSGWIAFDLWPRARGLPVFV